MTSALGAAPAGATSIGASAAASSAKVCGTRPDAGGGTSSTERRMPSSARWFCHSSASMPKRSACTL